MKKQYLLSILTLLVALVASSTASAEDAGGYTITNGKITWTGITVEAAAEYCSSTTDNEDGGYVYLYNVQTGKFLTAGNGYGVQASLSDVGMRLQIALSTDDAYTYTTTTGSGKNKKTTTTTITTYTVESRVLNSKQGEYLSPNGTGTAIYLDRKGVRTTGDYYSQPNWQFVTVSDGSNVTYKLQNYDRYYCGTSNSYSSYYGSSDYSTCYAGSENSSSVIFVDESGSNNTWRIVSEASYKEAMEQLDWGEINMNAFLQDGDFTRNNKDSIYWVWSEQNDAKIVDDMIQDGPYTSSTPTHWHQRGQQWLDNAVRGDFEGEGMYYVAEIYNEKQTLSQTLTISDNSSLSAGLYKLTCQGFYQDTSEGKTNDGKAYFFVKSVDSEGNLLSYDKIPLVPINNDETLGSSIENEPVKGTGKQCGIRAGQVFLNKASSFLNTVFVEVEDGATITIGLEQTEAAGWSVIDNFRLFACGKMNLYVDEDFETSYELTYKDSDGETVTKEGDPYEIFNFTDTYQYPTTLYLQRTMTAGKWTSICLPFNMTGEQVRQTFGENTKVSTMKGISEERNSTLLFEKYANLFSDGLTAGVPYIICPEIGPKTYEELNIQIGNDKKGVVIKNEPVYVISGVTKDNYNPSTVDLTKSAINSADKYNTNASETGSAYMIGNFYVQAKNTDNCIHKGEYYLVRNTLYKATAERPWYATYCKITYTAPTTGDDETSKAFTIAIDEDGVSEPTAIEGLYFEGFTNADATNSMNVYNVNGQKVASNGSLEGLPSGVYIINGKKVIK